MGQGNTFFVKLAGSGLPALLQRYGRGLRSVRLLYLLRPSVTIKPELKMEENIRAAVQSSWPIRAREAIAFALRRAGLE